MIDKRLLVLMRYGIILSVVLFIAFLIVLRAVSTTVIYADEWNAKTDTLLRRVYLVQPKRGDILACDGSILATNLTTYTICLDYRTAASREAKFVAALDSIADSLAVYYPQRTAMEWKKYLATPLAQVPEKRTQYHVLLKDANYDDYQRLLKFPFFKNYRRKYQHGLYYNTNEKRVLPYGSMAKRSIGRCSYQRGERYEGAVGDSIEMMRGYSGLERALDSLLYGKNGTAKKVQLTQSVSTWVDQPPVDGNSVVTTIDINMQDIVENELHDMLKTTKADWGTCILMEVATGDIKAISNLDRDKNGNYIEAMNYAKERFEPGSVMKPISMLIALEDGYAFPLDQVYPIGSSYAYAGGAPIHDTHSPSHLPVSRFIEYSSNIGMTRLMVPHYEKNLNGFRDRLAEIGFFDEFNTGISHERIPKFPTLDPKAGGRVSLSRMTYGYSTAIPPLYTCAIYNAIANDGKFVRPRLYKAIITPSGERIEKPVSYVRDSICSRTNAQILRDMLYGVVYGDGGTAKSLRNDIVTVVGKTGTSRIAYETHPDSIKKNKNRPLVTGYKENQYRLAFCGIYPYENPKYTCMVLISNPSPEYKGAATTSGTVVKNIALKMYARGMFDNSSEIRPVDNALSDPILYASALNEGQEASQAAFSFYSSVQAVTGGNTNHHLRTPQKSDGQGRIPDVRGLSIRDAVARLEDAGYNISIQGTGYALTQDPPAGSALARGSHVKVKFTQK